MSDGNGPHDCTSTTCNVKGLCKACMDNLGEAPGLRRRLDYANRRIDELEAVPPMSAIARDAVLKLLELCGTLTRIACVPVADSALEEIHEQLDWFHAHFGLALADNLRLGRRISELTSGEDHELVDSAAMAARAMLDRNHWRDAAMGALTRSCIGCAGNLPHRKVGNVHLWDDEPRPCTADPVLRDLAAELVK